MYEFVDVHGERVTVRSVRTLSGLLQRGTIVATTPFRRAEDASFSPAAEHPELLAIAGQFGVVLDGTVAHTPSPGMPPPALMPAMQPTSAPPMRPAAVLPVPRASVPPTMPAATLPSRTEPIPGGRGEPVPRATVLARRRSPWSRMTPLARHRPPEASTLARSVGIVLLNLVSAAVLGVVARFVVADATGNQFIALGAMLIATSCAGRYAGRIAASQMERPTGWAVCLATAVFGVGCYEVAGVLGLVITAAAVTPLWRCLSRSRH